MIQVMNKHQRMHHKEGRQFAMGDVTEAPHPTLPMVETHATTRSVKKLTAAATSRNYSPYLSTILMMLDEQLRHKAACQFDMGDVAEAPHPTLPRETTHATKGSVKISAEAATNSTASTCCPTIVMTAYELLGHEADRRFALRDVNNSDPLPTLPRAETLQPKNMNAPLNTRTTFSSNAAAENDNAAATAALVATSTVVYNERDPFKGVTSKK